MRFLIIDTDYPEFLHWFYLRHPSLETQSYEEQLKARTESLFGIASFYADNLRRLGQEASEVYANNEFMQRAWAQEHRIKIQDDSKISRELQRAMPWADRILGKLPSDSARNGRMQRAIPWASRMARERWSNRVLADVLIARVKEFEPDVLLNQAMDWVSSRLIRRMRRYVKLVVGQIAAPVPQGEDLRCYDLVISSLPNLVDYFRSRGTPSALSRLAFEPTILPRLDGGGGKIPVSFVGSLSRHHLDRIRLLERLCQYTDFQWWGPGIDRLSASSPLREHYQGTAWGVEMYRILRSSRITVNQHVDIAGSYANNLRLYEATGVGTLLVTDWKKNLHEMFEPDKEVLAYRSVEECAELIEHYLEDENGRKAIARTGQERTLGEHTYEARARELIGFVESRL